MFQIGKLYGVKKGMNNCTMWDVDGNKWSLHRKNIFLYVGEKIMFDYGGFLFLDLDGKMWFCEDSFIDHFPFGNPLEEVEF